MKHLIFCATLLGILLASLPSAATPLEDKVAALKKAIDTEIEARPKGASPVLSSRYGELGDSRMVGVALAQLLSQADSPGAGTNLEMQINQLLSSFTSKAVQKAGQDLILELQAERKARAAAAATEVQTMLNHVSEVIKNAKKPEDLDGLLVEEEKFQTERRSNYSQENQALYEQVSSAFDFTKSWQNYLSHVASGQGQLANNDLQSLSQNSFGMSVIPRSHILELMNPSSNPAASPPQPGAPLSIDETAKSMVRNIKTLDDMEPTLEKIEAMRHANGNNYGMMFPDTTILKQLIATYEGAKEGLPVDIGINVKYYTSNGITSELQRQLILYVIQKYFATYKGDAPGVDENPSVYVTRVVTDAVNRQDWFLLKQALNVRDFLDENAAERYYHNRSSGDAITSMQTGLNQEQAGQYMLAVLSYQNALKGLPDDTTLPKFIGDKLAGIQKDHPKEYEEGMQLVTNPPARPSYMSGRPAGMPAYPGTANPAAPTPASAVPGVTPASTNLPTGTAPAK